MQADFCSGEGIYLWVLGKYMVIKALENDTGETYLIWENRPLLGHWSRFHELCRFCFHKPYGIKLGLTEVICMLLGQICSVNKVGKLLTMHMLMLQLSCNVVPHMVHQTQILQTSQPMPRERK